jgi:hypothetical protein
MGSEVFVDVTYRGLELGRRLKLREVGPSTAYLEHGTPMPVGSLVVLATDEGLSIPVQVVRVHEQVAGADMPPGMRVQATGLEGSAASWWRELVSRDDPQIPELEVAPMRRPKPLEPPPMAPPPPVAAGPTEAPEAPPPPVVEMDADEPDDDRPTTLMSAVAAPEDTETSAAVADSEARSKGNGHMDGKEIQEALGTDPSAPAPAGSDSETSGNGETGAEERGRKGRGRRRRRR